MAIALLALPPFDRQVEAFKRGSLVPLRVPGRDFSRAFYLATHRQKYHSKALMRWLELCDN